MSRRIRPILTPAEVGALFAAIAATLEAGSEDDALAVFGTRRGINNAVRARDKLVAAMAPRRHAR